MVGAHAWSIFGAEEGCGGGVGVGWRRLATEDGAS